MGKVPKAYTEILNVETNDEVFLYIIKNLQKTIKSWDYFVNWQKVTNNILPIEKDLNTLNYLIGKENLEVVAAQLIKENPEVINTFPILIATREKNLSVLEPNKEGILKINDFNFSKTRTRKDDLTEKEINEAVEFLKKTTLLELFQNRKIKNLVDYVLGVEVGLDTNGRKNRTGTSMEKIVEILIKNLCEKNGWEYLTQAGVIDIKLKWGIKVPTDKSRRRYDFVIKNGAKILLGETNYYHGGGSKLKAVAGEFTNLNRHIEKYGYKFVWITDGLGWKTAVKPLRDAYNNIDYILNLKMVEQGVLEHIMKNL